MSDLSFNLVLAVGVILGFLCFATYDLLLLLSDYIRQKIKEKKENDKK